MSIVKKYIGFNFTKPLQEGESPVPNKDECFPMLLACSDGTGFRKVAEVNSKTPNTFKFGELLLVSKMSFGELTNGSIVTLENTDKIQNQCQMEQCTDEAAEDRVVYKLSHVEVCQDQIIDLGCYRNNIIGAMEDPKRLISPGCYHSIIYQVVPCEDNSYKAIILSANKDMSEETELAKSLEKTHFEKTPEVVKLEYDKAFWRNMAQEKTVSNAAEEERFQGILEGKAMEKEILDKIRDKPKMASLLNSTQHKAVMMALNDERKLVCIQGPPASGKSHTLAVLIAKIIEMKRKEVAKRKAIVLTPTREACKNLMEMSKEVAKRLRLPDVHEHTFMDLDSFSKMVEESPEQLALSNVLAEMEEKVQARDMSDRKFKEYKKTATNFLWIEKAKIIMPNVRVIFSTITSKFVEIAAKVEPLDNAICIIDEAGQVNVAETWPAVVKKMRIVLAGDMSQLPAVVLSPEDREVGFDDSLLKRIQVDKERYSLVLLDGQYRSHEVITEWSSRTFYDNSIRNCGPSSTIHNLMKKNPDITIRKIFDPLVLIDTSYESTNPSNRKSFEYKVILSQANRSGSDLSYANVREAEIVVEHHSHLRRLGIQDVAIITPYRSQKELIEKLMREQIEKETKEKKTDVLDFDEVKIGTVDSFQGKEFVAVIFSMVRSNPKFHLGFVQDLRRLNVAITRAKRHFMLVGNGIMLQKSRVDEIKNLFDIFVRDGHRFPPSFVYGEAVPYYLHNSRTNFGMNLVDFAEHCQESDPEMAEHCRRFSAQRNVNRENN